MEIQTLNGVGLGGSATAYLLGLAVTCFAMVASPFSEYIKRVCMGMYVLVLVKNFEMHNAGTQYWQYPFYFGFGVTGGAVIGTTALLLPFPR